jgi:hypothetical protein
VPEPEPHHVGTFLARKNDAALVIALTPFLPVLSSEKIKKLIITFFILHNIGLKIGVGAGARTGATTFLRFRHDK